MKRAYYSSDIESFCAQSPDEVVGILCEGSIFPVLQKQTKAWYAQNEILRGVLNGQSGKIFLEYSIPRLGGRIDALVILGPVIFVLEFKVGEKKFLSADFDQVSDYALDLKNFHATSHDKYICPILVCTEADEPDARIEVNGKRDKLLCPVAATGRTLGLVIQRALQFATGINIDATEWAEGRYCPTPTIVEAAMALYGGHKVEEISRSDAGAINLTTTSNTIDEIIKGSKANHQKAICFVTGVPGAGKTLVGLDIATSHIDKGNDLYSVFLSGNGPLVSILREALTRDKVRRVKEQGRKIKKGAVKSEVKMFVQNVHNFRDECLLDIGKPPPEHVALFDEAQRAWNVVQTSKFMSQKKGIAGFSKSEPEYLISCMDRHKDWAVIVCLVGGGQEINTGEAGIREWLVSIQRSFPAWRVYISPELHDSEYDANDILKQIEGAVPVTYKPELHLAVSMRSFRAENVSLFVKRLLDLKADEAVAALKTVKDRYPIVLTRSLSSAKKWLKAQASGSERYGIMVSSEAQRLKPHAIDVKSPMDPIHWFLNGKGDVRSSYYLEDVATEFHVQGLELDWTCVTWDADFRYTKSGWRNFSFSGDRWNKINKDERKIYQKNAYRVLLTRARQGMVIVVPEGDKEDRTRLPEFYDSTFEYLAGLGIPLVA